MKRSTIGLSAAAFRHGQSRDVARWKNRDGHGRVQMDNGGKGPRPRDEVADGGGRDPGWHQYNFAR